jgi:shikimate kinase / 3-dehydroquinate synthase
MSTPNIVLTGFMGSGKTVVGKAVAECLGRWFVDMDAAIERAAGQPVSAIFEQQGEATFRAMEAEMCRELAGESGLVIATGGGALLSEDNRRALGETGLLICLHAPAEVILARLEGAEDRPLLAGPDRRACVEALLAQRAAAYAAIPHHIDTAGLAVEQVAERVIQLARQTEGGMATIPVSYPGGGHYDILIGDGVLAVLGQAMLAAGLPPGRCAVVSQPAIAAAHAERLAAGLREAGFEPVVVEIPDGEAHKTLATAAGLYDAFVAAGLDRRSPVVALGGGVVGDVAGFVAATYLRGVPFVQAPTSLLAMVDASVGGKTGVDLPQGKNLVGAFKQPALVAIDPDTLKTLPSDEFRSGLAEVVKHGMIGDPGLFEVMEGRGMLSLGQLVARAVQVKVAVVQEDPFEQGRRAVLNLGHTFGHAYETLSGYGLRHGEAVSIGLVAATRLAARLELCDPALLQRVESLLVRLDLPTRAPSFDSSQVLAAMATDKKRIGSRLRFILPRAIGDVDVFGGVSDDLVLAVLAEMAA